MTKRIGKRPAGVLVLYNVPLSGRFAVSDAGVLVEVSAVVAALGRLGIPGRTQGVSSLHDVIRALDAAPEPVVFNLVEALAGPPSDMNAVPDICRAFGLGVTGCGSDCMSVTQDKVIGRAVLAAAGLTVPAGKVVRRGERPDRDGLPRGLCIVKPTACDASEGIDDRSVVRGHAAIARAVLRVHRDMKQDALIECFIAGREFNVSVIDKNGTGVVLPVAETDFSRFGGGKRRIVGYAAKWIEDSFEYVNTPRIVPAHITSAKEREVRQTAHAAWKACRCSGHARVDIRMDRFGKLYVLEVNANPDISPDAGFTAALEAAGMRFDEFVDLECRRAFAQVRARRNSVSRRVTRAVPVGLSIRTTVKPDRDAIMKMVETCGFFRRCEVDVARELLDEAVAKGPDGHYQSLTAHVSGRPAGWVCYGRTPCTEGTFDIYWIVVEPAFARKGIGRALMGAAEDGIRRAGGRLATIDTSGMPRYAPTLAFYRKLGYVERASIPDFYAPGDAKLVLTRLLVPRNTAKKRR